MKAKLKTWGYVCVVLFMVTASVVSGACVGFFDFCVREGFLHQKAYGSALERAYVTAEISPLED